MTAIDKLTVGIEGINTAQKNFEEFLKGHLCGIKIDADRLTVAGFLLFDIGIGGIYFFTTGVAADHIQNTVHFLESRCDAPEASTGKISGFKRFHM